MGLESYPDVVKEADFVVGILPQVPDNHGFFNYENTFSLMKESAVFMNIGRGSTCNEKELIEALKSKRIAGAALDVFEKEPLDQESELWSLDNVIVYPHCAFWDKNFLTNCTKQFETNLVKFCEG